jgi:hypothetical protein
MVVPSQFGLSVLIYCVTEILALWLWFLQVLNQWLESAVSRFVASIVAGVAILIPIAANADFAIPAGDIGNYCFYNNSLYSLASGICVGKTAYVCVPSTKQTNIGGRGYWYTSTSPLTIDGYTYNPPSCPLP